MAYKWALWLPDVLRAAGCPVVEEAGWRTRGRSGGTWEPMSITLHHDASPAGQTSHGVNVIMNGRPGLGGPLSQLWLDYEGRWHIVAAGRANHAGAGKWGDIPENRGNDYSIGIETDHTTNEQWTLAQNRSGIRGLIALADHLNIRTDATRLRNRLFAHKEWAPDRKIDPDPLNMRDLRAVVLSGVNTTRPGEAGGGTDEEEGLFGMSKLAAFSTTTPRSFTGDGNWKTLTIDDDGTKALLAGPVPLYSAMCELTIERTEDPDSVVTGDVVQARFQTVTDYPGDKPTVVSGWFTPFQVPITLGPSYGHLAWQNSLRDAPDAGGGTTRLHVAIRPPSGKRVLVTKVLTRVIHD